MMTEIISISFPEELRKKIDMIRGDIPRSKYIVRLVESTLTNEKSFVDASAGKSSEAANQQKIAGAQ